MAPRVSIVAVGDQTEAFGLRAVLEAMGHDVRLLRPANADGVTSALVKASEDDVVMLSAEGGADGLRLGDTWLPMMAAFDGVQFRDDAVLISTVAATRESGLVQVILNAGGHLVAPLGAPDRRLIVPWVAACLMQAEAGLAAAVAAANGLVGPDDQFSYG